MTGDDTMISDTLKAGGSSFINTFGRDKRNDIQGICNVRIQNKILFVVVQREKLITMGSFVV